MVAGCGIGFATGFGMQDMYDFSDPYLQNTFGMWGEDWPNAVRKSKKNRIPTTMLPAHLTFLHPHSNSPKTKDPMPSIPPVQYLRAGSCFSEKISRKPTRLWLPSSCVSWSWQGLLQIWQWKPDLSCATGLVKRNAYTCFLGTELQSCRTNFTSRGFCLWIISDWKTWLQINISYKAPKSGFWRLPTSGPQVL